MKIMERLQGLKTLRPSIFDLAIIGILGIPFISNPFIKGSYFVFYSFFLLCVSLSLRPNVQYRSIPLTILLVTSLGMIFVHRPYSIVPSPIMNMYFNVAIMSEGFIYILMGCVLFFTVVRYSVNYRLILLASLISFIPSVHFMLKVGSPVSLGLSLIMALSIWLLLNKKYRILGDISIVAILTAILNWNFIVAKGTCRPEIWLACLKNIKQHPFIGYGFNDTVMPDGLFRVGSWNWVYRHNNYLYIWEALGVVAFIAVLWWTVDCARRIGKTVYLIPFLFLVFLCNLKETMLLPERAVVVIVIAACCIKSTLKKGDV